jgi:hypothetical protein
LGGQGGAAFVWVPALPLFVHERLSTQAIIETLGSHKRDKQQTMFELFGDRSTLSPTKCCAPRSNRWN